MPKRSKTIITLSQAVQILNAGGFKPINSPELFWKAKDGQAVGYFGKNEHTTYSEPDAIHRARQLVRRMPPISKLADDVRKILKIEQYEKR